MLDKRTVRLMEALLKICGDGSYKIIETSDLIKAMLPKFKVSSEFVAQTIKYAADNELIDVKYSDNEKFCIAVLPKGRILEETGKKGSKRGISAPAERVTVSKGFVFVMMVGCFVAAFAGALLATLIFK